MPPIEATDPALLFVLGIMLGLVGMLGLLMLIWGLSPGPAQPGTGYLKWKKREERKARAKAWFRGLSS